jgi:hypothetical protein
VHANEVQRVADFVELEGFDDGNDEFHDGHPLVATACWSRPTTKTRRDGFAASRSAYDIGNPIKN